MFEGLMYAAIKWEEGHGCTFKTWAYRILWQRSIAFLRGNKIEKEYSNTIVLGDNVSPDSDQLLANNLPDYREQSNQNEQQELYNTVLELSKTLTIEDREVFYRVANGETQRLVAKDLGVSSQLVCFKYGRAVERLRKEMCKRGLMP
jgi:RNA polymerase sigma factor (sigma-70 family)